MKAADTPGFVRVIKTEEKGTDVNLASYLLTDAYASDYDIAVVISNDSDLAYPMKYVKCFLGKTVGLLNPQNNPSFELMKMQPFYKKIRPAVLAACQFPETITDLTGTFQRPAAWI